MSFIDDVRGIARGRIDLSIAEVIRDELERVSVPNRRPLDYYYVIDLVNPAQGYWRRAEPDTPRSPELMRRLASGRRLHYLARYWFRDLPGFQVEEANLNGHYVGVTGVVGRIDYLLRDEIFEFKTKPGSGVSANQAMTAYPQDLEQLLFYAALNPREPALNHLVFYSQSPDGGTRVDAFDVSFDHHEAIRDEMRARIRALNAWRAGSSGTEDIPRCRYFDELCEFREGICGCSSARPLNTVPLFDPVEISPNAALARAVADRAGGLEVPSDRFGLWDLIFQRQWYHRVFRYAIDEEMGPRGSDPDKRAGIALLDCSVRRTLGASWEESNELRAQSDPRLVGPQRYMRVNIPREGGETVVPYTCRYLRSQAVRAFSSLPPIYFAELAIQCARAGIGRGVIVVGYPDAPLPVAAYIVSFNPDRLESILERALRQMQTAREAGTPESLPLCPDWAWDGCEFMACSCRQTHA